MSKQLEPMCFWCGGNARFDFASEPRPFYPDTNHVCANCVSIRGPDEILIFELTEKNPGCGNPTLPFAQVYYTGRWVAITAQMVSCLFPAEMVPAIVAQGFAGLGEENYAIAGFNKYPWRTIQ